LPGNSSAQPEREATAERIRLPHARAEQRRVLGFMD
jgi:hypothetical protein